ncbi:hypothetical protein PV326_001018, partial [Microctonus aethiopoides]
TNFRVPDPAQEPRAYPLTPSTYPTTQSGIMVISIPEKCRRDLGHDNTPLVGIPQKYIAGSTIEGPTLELVQSMTNRRRLSRYSTTPPEMLGNKNPANERPEYKRREKKEEDGPLGDTWTYDLVDE